MEELTGANLNMDGVRNLCSAMLLQATKDYFAGNTGQKRLIIKDLRSDRCDLLTEGKSLIIAERLLKHPEEIEKRLDASRADIPQCKLGEELKCS